MATKKTNSKSKSNVSQSSQLTQFKFKWWMALIGVGVVAVLGIVIIQFSHAGGSGSATVYCSQGTCYQTPHAGAQQTTLEVRTATLTSRDIDPNDRYRACPGTGGQYQLYKRWVCLQP